MSEEPETKEEAKDIEQEKKPEDLLVETKHSIVINGVEIPYTVTCGTIVLKEETEKKGENAGQAEGEVPKATIFFMWLNRKPRNWSSSIAPQGSIRSAR